MKKLFTAASGLAVSEKEIGRFGYAFQKTAASQDLNPDLPSEGSTLELLAAIWRRMEDSNSRTLTDPLFSRQLL